MTKKEKAAYDKQYKKNNPDKIRKKNFDYLSRPKNRVHHLVHAAAYRSKLSGREINKEYLLNFKDCPPTHCDCCGVKFDYSVGKGPRRLSNNPSIDRVDNTKGYIPGNIAFICMKCNCTKGASSLAELRQIIKYMEKHGVK